MRVTGASATIGAMAAPPARPAICAARAGRRSSNNRHSGIARRARPGTHKRLWNMGSGLAAARRPGMTRMVEYRLLNHRQHLFRRAAERGLAARDDDRALDEDRVFDHRRDQRLLGEFRRVDAERGGFLFTQQRLGRHLHLAEQRLQLGGGIRCLEVFDDLGLDPLLAQQGQRGARGVAARVVIDADRHGLLPLKIAPRSSLGGPGTQANYLPKAGATSAMKRAISSLTWACGFNP